MDRSTNQKEMTAIIEPLIIDNFFLIKNVLMKIFIQITKTNDYDFKNINKQISQNIRKFVKGHHNGKNRTFLML